MRGKKQDPECLQSLPREAILPPLAMKRSSLCQMLLIIAEVSVPLCINEVLAMNARKTFMGGTVSKMYTDRNARIRLSILKSRVY